MTSIPKSGGALDFADLLLVPVRLLEDHPEIRRQLQTPGATSWSTMARNWISSSGARRTF